MSQGALCTPARRLSAAPVAALGLVSQLVTVVGVTAGAAWLLTRVDPLLEQETRNRKEACPTCEGTGYETCVCKRWNDDDDTGCSSCRKTGFMKCRSCGGGGTAVPIYVPIRK